MFHAKFQHHQTSDSEEDFLNVSTIHRHQVAILAMCIITFTIYVFLSLLWL